MSGENRNALPFGFEVEGYRITRLLGAGGFGITYLASESETDRKVAIKEYMPSGLARREVDGTVRPISESLRQGYAWGLDRFREEARTLARLRHPNIVATLRFFAAHETAYLVMDYIEGDSLGTVLNRVGTLGEVEVLELLDGLLSGLSAVHEAGYLHRDIKPDNVFIRRDSGKPVLLDFGAARQAIGQVTNTLTVIVSHGYAPFEQYTSKGEQGPWSDIYAVGATIYRCVTGDRPCTATDRVDAIFAGKPDPNVTAAVACKGRYSSTLLQAVDAALRTQPGERPQSVAQLKKAILGEPQSEPFGRREKASESRHETLVLRDSVGPKTAPRHVASKPAAQGSALPPAPRPAVPPLATAPAASRGAGGGMNMKTMWWVFGAGGGLLLFVLIAVVVIRVTADSQQRADSPKPPLRTTEASTRPRTEAPARQAPPAQPPAPPPATTATGPQRLAQACRAWQGISEAGCACIVRASTPVLQAGDYDGAIEIMGMVFTDKGDQARSRIQQLAGQNQAMAQRIVAAVQAIGRDCRNVQ
nr:serine/threonine-protein kinase [Nitrosomonas nitrosa]